MSTAERDPHTGHMTTGHEWNGITELNTRVPRAVYFFLIATGLFAIGYWILMPAFPLGTTYTKGVLGIDQRSIVANTLQAAALDRATWEKRIADEDFAQIQSDPQLMAVVRQTGHTLFGDNCAACHGREAQGGKGFPSLTTDSWLWGGMPDKIAETIRVGINSTHPESRVSQMLAFGRDGMLPRSDIESVVAYLRSLSPPHSGEAGVTMEQRAAGQAVFAKNCASCHGEQAMGNPDLGAPNLTDQFWIYGGDATAVFTTVWGGRQGHMPTWEARFSPVERKILALYLVDLRKPAP
jgi:cytochrome c oxidase cbb3-type subunit 3